MDRMQIALKLGMDILGIPVSVKNYQLICDAVYCAEQRGIYICESLPLEFDKKQMIVKSTARSAIGIRFSRNLYEVIFEIEEELIQGNDESRGWNLDKESTRRLEGLKK